VAHDDGANAENHASRQDTLNLIRTKQAMLCSQSQGVKIQPTKEDYQQISMYLWRYQ